jgi:hypothetical protein
MKKFIVKISAVFLIPLIPLFLIEISIAPLTQRFFEEKALERSFKQDVNSYAWLEILDSKPLNILAGSSSVKYGLSCKELNKLNPDSVRYVNLAMDARDPIQTYFILKKISLNKVKNVYFGLDPWIYTKRYYKHRKNYLYLDFNIIECFSYFIEHDKMVFLKRYKSFFKYLFKFSGGNIKKESTIPKDFGSVALHRTAVNFNNLDDWFQLEKYGWSDLQFQYLKKIEELCNVNKVRLSLFIPPKRSDYSEFYLEECKLIHIDYVDKLVQFGISSPIFGKFNLYDNVDDYTLFAEAYHLNEKGQIKFSKSFYELSVKQNIKFSKDYSWFIENTTN